MEGQVKLERVLIANRGEIARRLIRHYRDQGVETCVVFSEAEADQGYLDDADYAVYLNGRTVTETYLDPARVVAAAMDAGCDAIHPGYGFLAEHLDLYDLAHRSNIAVIGADPRALPLVVDQARLRGVAKKLGIPVVPASEILAPDDDGIAAAATIGAPLYVKSVQGGAMRLVDDLARLPDAIEAVRHVGRLAGDPGVILERAVDARRQIGTIVVADRQGTTTHLGETDGSLELDGRTWIEEAGDGVQPALAAQLGQAAVELARAVRWVGIGKVRWALTGHGGFYLLGFSARLTTGFDLVERVHDVDLLQSQFVALSGQPLLWDAGGAPVGCHGIQLRIFHVDPVARTRPEGVLERIVLPSDAATELGVEEGTLCTADSEPLLAKITVTAPTRHAAVVKAKAALEELVVEGVPTNVPVLRELVGRRIFWDGDYDVRTLERIVRGGG